MARVYLGRRQKFIGEHFWAHGYFVSTVGLEEAAVRDYIQAQEKEDRRLDRLNMFPE
jgi:putative transposase